MNAEQKKRIAHEISNWRNAAQGGIEEFKSTGERMTALLQELVDADDKFKIGVLAAINAAAPDARHVEVDGQPVFFSKSGDDITDTHTLAPCPHCGGSGAAEDCAPAPEPVARVTGYYGGYLSIETVDGRVLPAGTALYAAPPHQSEHHLEMVNTPAPSAPEPKPFGYFKSEPFGWTDCAETDDGAIALYTAQPAPSVPDEELQAAFDRGLKVGNEQKEAQQVEIHRLHDLLAATPTQPEPPAELPTWENGDDPLVGGGLISRGVVDFATVGIWPTKPAPSVPDGWKHDCAGILQNDVELWLDSCPHCGKPKTDASPTPAEAPADVARDAWYGSNPPSLVQATAIYMALLEAAKNQQKLSDERILELFDEHATPDRWPFGFARAIGAAMREKGQS